MNSSLSLHFLLISTVPPESSPMPLFNQPIFQPTLRLIMRRVRSSANTGRAHMALVQGTLRRKRRKRRSRRRGGNKCSGVSQPSCCP